MINTHYVTVPVDQESWCGLAGCLWLNVAHLMKLQSSCRPELWSPL